MKIRPLLFSVLVIMFATTGCLFSPDSSDDGDPPPVDPHVFPDTADKLVRNFERYYGERNLERYREVLSEDYRFINQDNSEYNYDRELEIADQMFNEVAGDGGIAFTEINVEFLNPPGPRQPTPGHAPNWGRAAGRPPRASHVRLRFKVAGEDLWFVVGGLVKFYVTTRDVEVDGATRTKYELLGQHEQTEGGDGG